MYGKHPRSFSNTPAFANTITKIAIKEGFGPPFFMLIGMSCKYGKMLGEIWGEVEGVATVRVLGYTSGGAPRRRQAHAP